MGTMLIYIILMLTTTVQGDMTDQLSSSWTLGVVIDEHNVKASKPSRGGLTHMILNKDGSLIFSNPFSCGFGTYKEGTWELDIQKKELTMSFRTLKGYLNNPTVKTLMRLRFIRFYISRMTHLF